MINWSTLAFPLHLLVLDLTYGCNIKTWQSMVVQIQCFGIARDICGGDFIDAVLEDGSSVLDLQHMLREKFPALAELRHFFIARNQVYAQADELIQANDELVIIPPVSGG